MKKFIIEKLKNLINNMALPAVIYAENLLGSGLGSEKKEIAIEFILGRLPLFLLPIRSILKRLLYDLLDFVVEEGVKKLQNIQKNLPGALI